MPKRTSFFILLFLSSLILISLFSGCLPVTPVTVTGTVSGYVALPDNTKDLTGYSPVPGATVTIVDADGLTHTVLTDENGYYYFNNISIKTNTIINITKDTEGGGKLIFKDIVPLAVSQEEDYDAGIADAESTAIALVVEGLVNLGQVQEEIDLDEITSSDGFDELKEDVQQAQEDNQDFTTDNPVNTQAEEIADNIVNPPEPTPDPTPPSPPAATLESIAITTPTSKLSYSIDDVLDITGLVVTGSYSDTTTKVETITTGNITGFDSSTPAVGQLLTITVGGKTTTYTVTIVATPITDIAAITGTPKVGVELTAGALTPSAATATYQWRISSDGTTYADISGATTNKYIPVAGDATKFIRVVATGTGSYSGNVTSAATEVVANADQSAPTGLAGVAPTTYGGADGKITGTTTAMEYKLSTGGTYTTATASPTTVGAAGTYQVRYAAKTGYNAGTPVDVIVAAGAPSEMDGTVSITGTAKFGQVLTADITGITYIPTTTLDLPTYQWKRNGGTNIGSATASTYILVEADLGATITVTVTADGTHATGNITSAPTAAVAAIVINIAAIPGVTAPVTGATPVTAITPTDQYTGTVTWSGTPGTFAGTTVYTATITLTEKAGFTLTGVTADFFTVDGVTTPTNDIDSGVVSAVFPATAQKQLTIAAPTLTLSKPYDGDTSAVVTAGALSGVVVGDTVTVSAVATYDTAAVGTGKTITVVYTLAGADAAKYVKPVDYVVATGVISAVTISIAAIPGVTVPVKNAIPVTTIDATAQYTGTVAWSPAHSPFWAVTIYTATITLTVKTGYTLTGVAANFFTVDGEAATNIANSGEVTAAAFSATGALAIGDNYQGGKIAYILQVGDLGYDASVQHGLIAATADQGTGIQWYNGSEVVTGATGTAIGTGQDNTTAILTIQGAGSYAAQLCNDLTVGGETDWFLPSKDELYKLYINRVAIGGFATGYYWSSSELDTREADCLSFYYATWTGHWKDSPDHVRAVRTF